MELTPHPFVYGDWANHPVYQAIKYGVSRGTKSNPSHWVDKISKLGRSAKRPLPLTPPPSPQKMVYKRTRRSNVVRRSNRRRVSKSKWSRPMTFQKDLVNTYSKGRPNKRRVRRAKSFVGKVIKVLENVHGNQTWCEFATGTSGSNLSEQGMMCFTLGGGSSNEFPYLEDVVDKVNNPLTTLSPGLLHVDSMYMELTIKNTSAADQDIYFTCYYFTTRRGLTSSQGPIQSFYAQALSNNDLLEGGGNIVLQPDLRATPFMAGQWCQHFLISKIQKIRIAVGESTVISLKDPRSRSIRNDSIQEYSAIKGVTQGVLILFQGEMDNNGNPQVSTCGWNMKTQINCRAFEKSNNAVSKP